MELHELEEYVEALEKLLKRVKAKEMEAAKESEKQLSFASDSVGLNLDAFQDQMDYFMKTSEENDAREGEIVQDVCLFDDDLWCLKTN